ncbi:MAG: NAD-dependent deacylase [Gammaproteobacteria bacterium]|nr:NAD-dependent deacylase [Gammaproteobacteria bacterium]
MLNSSEKIIPQLAAQLLSAQRIVVMTGAGVSAESGISTFRDSEDSYWSQFDPMTLASLDGFSDNPQRVWHWYQWRRQQIALARPNPAHVGLAQLQRRLPLYLITQNVDGLHQQAGSQQVCELHGNIFINQCVSVSCNYREQHQDNASDLITCPQCQQAYLRPGVVWFGECLAAERLEAADLASRDCDLFLSMGTSAAVYPAAGFAALAKQSGAQIIEINPAATPLSEHADWVIRAPVGSVFERLMPLLS